MTAYQQEKETDDILWQQLKTLPAFRAVLRSVETRFYQKLDLTHPILDLGCGDGHFAQMTFDEKIDVGIDPWWEPLQEAAQSDCYHSVQQSMGDQMPFASHTFHTVISNSVLEHIPDIQPVLNEASRVLKVGGQLVITMPSHYFTQNLAGAQFFEALGLTNVAHAYRRFFNKISRHAHTDSAEVWAERLARAGFVVDRWQYYFSQEALHALEWGHVQGLPALLMRKLTGFWVVAPARNNLFFTERWLRPFYEEEAPADGAYVLFIAHKASDLPVTCHLPPADPFTISELESTTAVKVTPRAGTVLPAIDLAHKDPAADQAVWEPTLLGQRVITTVFIAIALLSAYLGQWALTDGETIIGGLWFYGLSLFTLWGLAWYRRGMEATTPLSTFTLPNLRKMTPKRWGIGGALFLSLIASGLGSSIPILGLLLWLLAGIIGFYTLHHSGERLQLWQKIRHWSLEEKIGVSLLGVFALSVRLVDLVQHPFILNGNEANIGLNALRLMQGSGGSPFATGWLTTPNFVIYLQSLPLRFLGASTLSIRLMSAIVGTLTVLAVYLIGRQMWRPAVGAVAGIFLAGSHVHIHYSRLGTTNIWDPLIALLAVGLVIIAWQQKKRIWWLLAGIFMGLTPYFFTTARLFPLMFLVGALLLVISQRETLQTQWRHMVAGLLLAWVLALPQVRYYNAQPHIFMDRANVLGIRESGWLTNEQAQTGKSTGELWQEQAKLALFSFNATPDTSINYQSGRPMLTSVPALFFMLGLGMALWHWRQVRYGLLLSWWGVTVVFAGILLVNPPASHRLLIALPVACLLAAVSLVWIGRRIMEGYQWPAQNLLVGLMVIALLSTSQDLVFYFGDYRESPLFADRNTEIADKVSRYLNSLEGEKTVYFDGAPNMFVTFPTFEFLLNDWQSNSLLDMTESTLPAIVETNKAHLVFVFLPEKQADILLVQDAFPNGDLRHFAGIHASPLFYTYEVTP